MPEQSGLGNHKPGMGFVAWAAQTVRLSFPKTMLAFNNGKNRKLAAL